MPIEHSPARLVQYWNETYFGGELPPTTLGLMTPDAPLAEDAEALVERGLRLCHQTHLRARDFSPLHAWAFGRLMPKMVPSAWGGLIPPVTRAGRHQRIDEYVARTPWRPTAAGGTFLDIGCGFPPTTTVETAERFPDWNIVGLDPKFHPYVVRDVEGDYACLDARGRVVYFQPGTSDLAKWDALFANKRATSERFERLAAPLLAALDRFADHSLAALELDRVRLEKNPIQQYQSANLRFHAGEFGDASIGQVDVARCFNVLIYFDAAASRRALDWLAMILNPGGLFVCGVDWVHTSGARYTVFRREGDGLVEKEFAFSVDNIRPVNPVSLIAFHDDEYEMERLSELVALLRSDPSFRANYDRAMDLALEQLGLGVRDSDGNLGGPTDPATQDLDDRLGGLEDALSKAGMVDAAVECLRRHGVDAWRNCVGHIAVAYSFSSLA